MASAWYSLESMLLSTHLLFKDSQQKQMDDHLVWFAATEVESKLSIDSVGVSLYVFPQIDLHKQVERSLLGKSFVFVTYKYEWSTVDKESCSGKGSQIHLRNENEIPLFREFLFSGTTNKTLSEYLSGIHFLLSGTISEEALIVPYFGTIETRERFQVNMSIRTDGGLTLETSASLSGLHWKFNWPSSTRLMPNFDVSLSHRRDAAVSCQTNHSSFQVSFADCWLTFDVL